MAHSLAVFVILVVIFIFGKCEQNSPYDVIVVGLGAAGTSAASSLAAAGKRVLALEAQGYVGGRVHTVPFGDNIVEVGAEWIHGEDPNRVFESAVERHLNIIRDDSEPQVYRSDGTMGDMALFNELVDFCLSQGMGSNVKNETWGSLITKRLSDYLKQTRPALINDEDFLHQFLNYMNLYINNGVAANDWNDVSVYTEWKQPKGHLRWSWHALGFNTFFEILLKTAISRHTSMFSPKLPSTKINAIENLSIGVVGKIILSFDQAWWPVNTGFEFIWKGEDLMKVPAEDYWTTRVYSAHTPLGNNNTLTLWTSGNVAKHVETLPENVVKTKLMGILRKFLGANMTIPKPTAILRSTWFSNPFTRGAYSYDTLTSMAGTNLRRVLAEPILDDAGQPLILFAGEATNHEQYSTVHGASDTGIREAARLLFITS